MEGLAKGTKRKAGESAVAEIVGTLLMARTFAHMAHLKTSSYAKHVALDEFYTAIVDLTDSFAEIAQGKFGKMDIPVVAVKGNVDSPIPEMEKQIDKLLNLGSSCNSGALKNILDEIEALYLTTLYKLKELN